MAVRWVFLLLTLAASASAAPEDWIEACQNVVRCIKGVSVTQVSPSRVTATGPDGGNKTYNYAQLLKAGRLQTKMCVEVGGGPDSTCRKTIKGQCYGTPFLTCPTTGLGWGVRTGPKITVPPKPFRMNETTFGGVWFCADVTLSLFNGKQADSALPVDPRHQTLLTALRANISSANPWYMVASLPPFLMHSNWPASMEPYTNVSVSFARQALTLSPRPNTTHSEGLAVVIPAEDVDSYGMLVTCRAASQAESTACGTASGAECARTSRANGQLMFTMTLVFGPKTADGSPIPDGGLLVAPPGNK